MEVHIKKMSNIRYGKPNMNNLPYEHGREIFEENNQFTENR